MTDRTCLNCDATLAGEHQSRKFCDAKCRGRFRRRQERATPQVNRFRETAPMGRFVTYDQVRGGSA